MFNWFKKDKDKEIPEPKIGMILTHKEWGRSYATIQITRVSSSKQNVMYKFLVVNDDRATNDEYELNWKYGILNLYNLEEDYEDT